MLLAMILSMCGPAPFRVSPAPEEVPDHATLWASPSNVEFIVEDASGRPLPFRAVVRDGAKEFTVDLPEGSEFYVREDTRGRRLMFRDQGKRLGPWRVGRGAPKAPTSAPGISRDEEVVSDGCPLTRLWWLESDLPAPMYEIELADGFRTKVIWSRSLAIGESCETNWDWANGGARVTVRAHFSDGSASRWSNTLLLSTPTEPLLIQGLRFVNGILK